MDGGKNKIIDKPKNKFKRKLQGIKRMVESKLTSKSQNL